MATKDRLLARLHNTLDQLWRWPTWIAVPLLIIYVLVQNALATWADHQVAKLGPGMVQAAAEYVTTHLPAFVVPGVLLALIMHAYFEARRDERRIREEAPPGAEESPSGSEVKYPSGRQDAIVTPKPVAIGPPAVVTSPDPPAQEIADFTLEDWRANTNQTSAQVAKWAEPYIGKWLKVSSKIRNVGA